MALGLLGCPSGGQQIRPPAEYRSEEPTLGPSVLLHDPNERPRFELRLDSYPAVELPLSQVQVEWLPGPCEAGCVRGLEQLLQLPEAGAPQPLATPSGLVEPIESRLKPLLREKGPVARIECRARRFEARRAAGDQVQMGIILDVRLGPADGPPGVGMTTAYQLSLRSAPMDEAELDEVKRFLALQAFDRLVFTGQLLDSLKAIAEELEQRAEDAEPAPVGSEAI